MESTSISEFPSKIMKENCDCCDWGCNNIAAYATSSSLHFFFFNQDCLLRLYSNNFKAGIITSIAFHPDGRIIAIGTNLGHIIIWDIENRQTIGYYISFSGSTFTALKWYKTFLFSLNENYLTCMAYLPGSHAKNDSKNFGLFIIWAKLLPFPVFRLSVISYEPQKISILISGTNSFSIYQSICQYQKSNNPSSNTTSSSLPKLTSKFSSNSVDTENSFESPNNQLMFMKVPSQPITIDENVQILMENANITDTNWSIHFKQFPLVATNHEISLFHSESHSIIPIITLPIASSPIKSVIQISSTYQKIIILHNNGRLSFYCHNKETKLPNNHYFNYILKQELVLSYLTSEIMMVKPSPIIDDRLFFVAENLGASLIRIEDNLMNIISGCYTFPMKTSSLAANNNLYALGTELGYIIIGSFDSKQLYRYSIPNKKTPVQYVGISPKEMKIYWMADGDTGYINLKQREVVTFPARTSGKSAIKCRCSVNGGFVLQRNPRVLGVFINGHEKALMFEQEIIDFAFNENKSDIAEGQIAVILKPNFFQLISYYSNGTFSKTPKYLIQTEHQPISLAYSEDYLIVALSSGDIYSMNNRTRKFGKFSIDSKNISHLEFQGKSLLGICDKGIFRFDDYIQISERTSDSTFSFLSSNDLRVYNGFGITDYSFFGNNNVLVLTQEGKARVVYLDTFQSLKKDITHLNPPSKDEMAKEFIIQEHNNKCWFSYKAKIIWQILLNQNLPLKDLRDYALTDDSRIYDMIIFNIISRAKLFSDSVLQQQLQTSLYLGDLDSASNVIIPSDQDSDLNFLYKATLSSLIVAIKNYKESEIEPLKAHLKSMASSLEQRKSYLDAANFLIIGGNYEEAFQLLIQNQLRNEALALCRTALKGELKKSKLRLLALSYLNLDQDYAMHLFASAGEFHAVLHMMNDNGLVIDAMFLLKELKKRNLLKEASSDVKKSFEGLSNLETLCSSIEESFESYGKSLEIEDSILNKVLSLN